MSNLEQDGMEAVAIIGMVCRVPGASDVDAFWEILKKGGVTITHFDEDELAASVPASLRRNPRYIRARGVLEGADLFDGAFFGMSPVECQATDPQHRLFLEACWEALENAGYAPDSAPGLVGVFAGMANNSYYPALLKHRPDLVERYGDASTMVGNEKDYLATRVAYKLGLTGPAINVYTACSTSLVAVCEAYHSLLAYRSDLALAGGVTVYYPQERGYLYQEGAITSSDGYCRPFDADSDGTVFSSGLGVVVLKRLSEALEDGDTIHAVIRGVGMNNDGARRTSFSAPSVDGQAQAIALAHATADVRPGDIGYVEAHGTATRLGDPIEIEGLTQAFGPDVPRGRCAIGAVKGNIGHLDAAAGVAGLIKTTLVLRHGQIPPVANYRAPNPRIDFDATPFYVSDRLHDWPADRTPRLAGVSAFGTGGTNAHVVLEEPPALDDTSDGRPFEVLCLSARSPAALDAATDRLADHLERHQDISLADAAHTLQVGRSTFQHRRVVVAKDRADAVDALRSRRPNSCVTREAPSRATPRPVAFMFPGQGSQYVGMGRNLYDIEPVFRAAFDRCADLFAPVIGADLRDVLFPEKNDEAAAERLRQTVFSQSGLFSIEYSLAALWRHWGIEPESMIGHSVGEFVAACIAGVFSLEDAARMVGTRGRLMQSQPPGSMLSVRMPVEDLERRLGPDVAIASVNGDALAVVSGPTPAIEALNAELTAAGIVAKLLHTSHAFHSPMMDPVLEPFGETVRSVRLSPPTIPFVSTVTGEWITAEQATDPAYWTGHLRATVRFSDGIRTLMEDGDRILLEVGPRATLSTLARQQARDARQQAAVPSLADRSEDGEEWRALNLAVGQLWAIGRSVNWNTYRAAERRRRVALPTYPFERRSYWIEPQPAEDAPPPNAPLHETLMPEIEMASAAVTSRRVDRLVAEVAAELEATSGMEVSPEHADATLLELGFDSLLLTQVSLSLAKRFNVEIVFRQLMEDLATPRAIAQYIDAQLPAETAPPVVQPAVAIRQRPSAEVARPAGDLTVDRLIAEQLEIMRQQLEVLRSGGRESVVDARAPVAQPTSHPAAAASVHTNGKASDASPAPAKPFGAAARIDLRNTFSLTPDQRKWLDDFIARYTAKTGKSRSFTERHRPTLADPRVVSGFTPLLKELVYPIVVERAKGARLWDVDGTEYIDMVNGFGSNFLGYSSPVVVEALARRLDIGYAIGPQHPLAGEVAEMVREFTGLPRVAFCNTGSEAVLGAIRTARTVTGRSCIVMFRDSYHGIMDEVIVRGGAGHRSVPAAPGIPRSAVQEILVLDYGDDASLDVIRERADTIAGVLIEPVQSRHLDLQPREFLHKLRDLTTQADIPLIFDEVVTGFRVAPGGAQEYFGVRADIATYGKVVGGGLPIGVIAGIPRYLDALDGGQWSFGDDSFPAVGVTYFAGTFVRHPLALTAAHAVLTHLREQGPALQERINDLAARTVARLEAICRELGAPIRFQHFSSVFQIVFTADAPCASLLFPLLRERGIHTFEGRGWFFTAAHTQEDADRVIEAFRDAVSELLRIGLLPRVGSAEPVHTVEPMRAVAEPVFSAATPPTPDARLGRDPNGRPAWFRPDPDRPGKYLKVGS